MIIAVWIPLLLPLFAVPAARRLAEALPPRAAAWMLTVTALVLATAGTASLALLAAAGLLRLPAVAEFGHLSLSWLQRTSPAAGPISVPAAAALCAIAGLLVRTACRHRGDLARARTRVLTAGAGRSELVVLPVAHPDAYALPGRPGRIVVTAGMLQALDAGERNALVAHERAHLAGRHHVFLAAAHYAATAHPALRWLRDPISYHLERWADEAAAESVGDRGLTARAIGRAALAAAAAGRSARPSFIPAAHTGPVPRRVVALLAPCPEPTPSRRGTAVALLLAVCLCASAGAALDATQDLHRTVETAQADPVPAGDAGHGR